MDGIVHVVPERAGHVALDDALATVRADESPEIVVLLDEIVRLTAERILVGEHQHVWKS